MSWLPHWLQTIVEHPAFEVAVKGSMVAGAVQGAAGYIVLAERWTASWIQDRIGPNRCGPYGLLQPLSDAIKLIFKEDILPKHVNRVFFILAPIISLVPALATLAVVPFGATITLDSGRQIALQVADVDVGVLFVFALASLGVYGLALGGWSSNSRYSLLGGVRSCAQVISYELSLTLSVLTVILLTGTLRLNEIVLAQGPWPWQWHAFGHHAGLAAGGAGGLLVRLALFVPLSVAAVVFIISAFAETNRLPFDVPEAESELVSGYHTEYSSMKFGLFFLAEYGNMLTACALATTLFFGGWLFPGWDGPFMQAHPWILGLVSTGTFCLKLGGCMFMMIWVRWTLPRFRFDQLMELGWKRLLPLAFACVALAATLRVVGDFLIPGATSSKVHRHELRWHEESYLWGVAKGLLQTLKHFVRRPGAQFTVQYPEVRWPLPPGYRGAPVLVTGDDGNERCVACLMCMFVCPPQAIYIEAEETTLDKERRPAVFDIDFGRCIFCGYCEEACPEIAIVLKDEFELAAFTRAELILPKQRLLEMGLKPRGSFVYPIEARGPEPPRAPLGGGPA